MSVYDDLIAELNEIESKLNSLYSRKEEVLARVKSFRSMLSQAVTAHESFEDSMKEFESLAMETKFMLMEAKIFIKRYGKVFPTPPQKKNKYIILKYFWPKWIS